jgi:hypothetical protein
MAAVECHDAELHAIAAEQARTCGEITGGCSCTHLELSFALITRRMTRGVAHPFRMIDRL